MKILVPVPEEQYMAALRKKIDHSHSYGKERFNGFCGKECFYINYHPAETLGTFGSSVFNGVIGRARKENDETVISYYLFYGLTDPLSLVLLYTVSWLLFLLVRIPDPAMYGFWTTVGGALFTFLCSFLTASGKRGAKAIHKLFKDLIPRQE